MILHRLTPRTPIRRTNGPIPATPDVFCIPETLRKMEDSRGWGGWLPWVDEKVRKPWEASLAAVEQRRDLNCKVVDEFDRWLEKVLGLFEYFIFKVSCQICQRKLESGQDLANCLGKEEPPRNQRCT